MARPREIKKRIRAVKTIQRITKTMQMIATARFTTALQRAAAARPYSERIRRLMGEVLAASDTDDLEHPLLDGPPEAVSRERLLVISSNRGMCGAYNANVLRAAMERTRELRARDVELDLETAGKKAVAYFRFQKIPIGRQNHVADQPSYDEVEALARRYLDEFAQGRLDAIRVAYMHFVSNARQEPRIVQLLPLEASAAERPEGEGAEPLHDFSPEPQEILADLVPLVVRTTLYQAFLDAAVSEQIMRMVAMRAATDNARELSRTLTRRFNRARQQLITTELMEIIAGAAALG